MAVVKRVCNESMLAAQAEIKNTPAYIVGGEVNYIKFDRFSRLVTPLF